ncbi:hypothetical protein D3C72_1769390 [compost metagenome]
MACAISRLPLAWAMLSCSRLSTRWFSSWVASLRRRISLTCCRRAAACSGAMRVAAAAAASPSSSTRIWKISRYWRSEGSGTMSCPRAVRTAKPAPISRLIASRSGVRDTPSALARLRSCSGWLMGNWPSWIMSSMVE